MIFGILEYLLIGLLVLLLIRASITDWRARDISNNLNLTIALMAPFFWWATGLTLWPDCAIQIGYGLLLFAVGALLFYFGAMGGGDVKLLSALALWFPGLMMLKLIVVMSIAGGVLTGVMLILHKRRKSEEPIEIPYGLAISFAALWVLCERYINHFE